MVKIVDHDKRREEMSATAARIIAKSGLENLTTRRLASEVGCSLGIVSYYFSNKYEMVAAALNWSNANIFQRLTKFNQSEEYDLEQFKEMLNLFLPLTRQTDIEWRVRLNLMAYSVTDRKLRNTHRQRLDLGYEYASAYLETLQRKGEVRQGVDPGTLAINSVDMIIGLSTFLVMIPMKQRAERAKAVDVYIDEFVSAK